MSLANVAFLNSDLLSRDSDGWYQLLPAGYFSAVDGRPTDVPGGRWFMDESIFERLWLQVQSAQTKVVVDYDHQTLRKDENGQPAPAAGWFQEMQWRDGSGIWIRPTWTEKAQRMIQAGEYMYLSAVFPYDPATGVPLRIHSAALTNRPGVDGLAPLASLSASVLTHQEKTGMNELLKKLLAGLGINVDSEPTTEQATAALSALSELQTKASSVEALNGKLAALSANPTKSATPDPAKYVPIEVVTAMQAQIASLSEQHRTSELEQLISKAKADGRLLPAMEAWARDLGSKDVAALSAFLDRAQPIAALSAMQTSTVKTPEAASPVAALSAEEKEAARLLGKTEEEFAAAKSAK